MPTANQPLDPVVESPVTPSSQPVLLDAIVTSAMDAVIALDAEQQIVLFNPAAETMFGCSSDEAVGQPLDRFLPVRFRGVHHRHVAMFGATGDTSRAMGHLRPLAALRSDGQEFPIEATISRVAIGGRPYYAAIVRDITARQVTEMALQRQADLLDLAYDAIFTWEWGGAITSWHRGAARLYGYVGQEAIGRVSHDLLRTRHPDGLSTVLEALERDQTWEGELRHTRRDRREIIVESRHVLVREGERVYVLEANRDATARKQAESERSLVRAREVAAQAKATALAVQRDQLHEILEGMPSGVFILAGPDGRVEFANPALTELVSGNALTLSGPPAYGRDFRYLRADGTPLPTEERPGLRALRGERVRNQQLLLERGDERLPISAHAAPLREGPDGPARAIVVLQDVTHLREAEQLKDDFLALISHEFRTPLTAIHGGAHLLASEHAELDAATRAELLADVVAESERLDRMLANILSLADVLGGRLRPVTEPVLIAPIVRRVAVDIGKRSSRHHFPIDIPRDLPPIEADSAIMEEVLYNLYENAVKYAPDGGEVRTRATTDGKAIVLAITDQGTGIAPEHVSTVFERFRRVGGDATVRGMGLGLYLSRHLVEAQGGQIRASSPGIGQGTTFSVTLPVAQGWTEDNSVVDGV